MTLTPVGFSKHLKKNRVMRAAVDGTDIVIWRSASGKLSAWDNRCPHRGMRLSYGFVRGETLACIYHGWHYGVEGNCRYIPAHPDLDPPKSITCTRHSIVEQDEVLWVSVQEDDLQPDRLVGAHPLRSLTFDCPLALAVTGFKEVHLVDETGKTLVFDHTLSKKCLLSFSTQEGTTTITILLQENSETSISAHVLCSRNWTVEGKLDVSKWCELVRRNAESATAGLAGVK